MLHRLTLLAHASTAAMREQRFARDEDLEPRGIEAAKALAGVIRATGSVLSSPSPAALVTAAALGLKPAPDPALRDLDVGRWSGLSLQEIAGRESGALAGWTSDPHACPHGGESIAALGQRVAAWLEARREQRSTLAVTHAFVVRAAVAAVMGAPPEAVFRIDVPPLTRLVLAGDGRRWMLRALIPAASLRRP